MVETCSFNNIISIRYPRPNPYTQAKSMEQTVTPPPARPKSLISDPTEPVTVANFSLGLYETRLPSDYYLVTQKATNNGPLASPQSDVTQSQTVAT